MRSASTFRWRSATAMPQRLAQRVLLRNELLLRETVRWPASVPRYDGVARRSGGIGRRAGLKIRWPSRAVWVRPPPSASSGSRPPRTAYATVPATSKRRPHHPSKGFGVPSPTARSCQAFHWSPATTRSGRPAPATRPIRTGHRSTVTGGPAAPRARPAGSWKKTMKPIAQDQPRADQRPYCRGPHSPREVRLRAVACGCTVTRTVYVADRSLQARGRMAKSVGILTGGGDCPGLNAVIRAVVRRARRGRLGRRRRSRGLARARRAGLRATSARSRSRGSSARRHDHRHEPHEPVQARGRRRARAPELLATVVSTRSSRSAARTRSASRRACTRSTSCRSSASRRRSTTTSPAPTTRSASTPRSAIATEAIDRLHTTAESHNRVMVVEVMGRHAGWIAVMSGIAGGADVILVPEIPVDFGGGRRERSGSGTRAARTSIVVVSEGCELPGARGRGRATSSGT